MPRLTSGQAGLSVMCCRVSGIPLASVGCGGRAGSGRLVRSDARAARYRFAVRGEPHGCGVGAGLVQPRSGSRGCAGSSPGSRPSSDLLRGGSRRVCGCVLDLRARVGLRGACRGPLRPGGRSGARRRDGAHLARVDHRFGAGRSACMGACGRARCCARPCDRWRSDPDSWLGGHLPCPGAGGATPVAGAVALAGAATVIASHSRSAAGRPEPGAPAWLRGAQRRSLPARDPARQWVVTRSGGCGPDRDADPARGDRKRTGGDREAGEPSLSVRRQASS